MSQIWKCVIFLLAKLEVCLYLNILSENVDWIGQSN